MPSLGIAPHPGGAWGHDRTPYRARRRFQLSFRRMRTCICWRLGFKQSSLRHIARASLCTVSDN